MNKLTQFKNLHYQKELLFLPNAWDVVSALVLEQVGFKAIGTTSYGVANSLGYTDGQKIKFDDILALVRKLVRAVKVPITVDVESGYSNNIDDIASNILIIADLGCSGINIEDSLKDEVGLSDTPKQCDLIHAIRSKLEANGFGDFFINVRTDTFLQISDPLDETIERAISYVNSGASGIFVPGLYKINEIERVVSSISVPLNLMSLPNLTNANILSDIGVKRFSLGYAFSEATVSFIEKSAQKIFTERNTHELYSDYKIKTSFR